MKFAAWRKVLSIFLLAVFLCAVPSLLTACSRTPGSDSTELDYATSRYFQALYRIVNKTFHPAVLEEFHQIADAHGSNPGHSGAESRAKCGWELCAARASRGMAFLYF